MADEFARKGAARDAARAKLLRRAATLLRELDGVVATWDLTAWTVAIAAMVAELEGAAVEDDASALECFEDTPLPVSGTAPRTAEPAPSPSAPSTPPAEAAPRALVPRRG